MTVSSSKKRVHGLEPPLRRVLAVDAGTRCIRLLLMESHFGKLRVLRQDVLDLQQEGLVATEELQAHLQKTLAQWGRPPIALVLPQAVAVSQIVDLTPVPDEEARKHIEDETIKLAGVSESALVYDFVRVAPQVDGRQSFWVTFCQESEIQNRISQLGLDRDDFREITTAANALLTVWQIRYQVRGIRCQVRGAGCQVLTPDTLHLTPDTSHLIPSNAVLVHSGAQGTTVVVIREGTGVFAASFPMGGDFFTRAVARLKRCSNEAAEAAKLSSNLLAGAQALPGFPEIVDGWAAELKRQLAEWRNSRPQTAGAPAQFVLIASGGTFEQPGLLEYLAPWSRGVGTTLGLVSLTPRGEPATAGLTFQRWPTDDTAETLLPAMGFEIALGAGLQALGLSPQPVSLLPANRRAVWRQRLGRQRLEFANAVLLLVCLLVLGFGLWRKVSLIQRKQELLAKVQAGLETVQANSALTGDLLNSYKTMRPVFEQQQSTVDTLQSLALLQQARSNGAPWLVLVADQQSYFSHPPTFSLSVSNKPAGPTLELDGGRYRESTNSAPARPGLIAELCIPDTAEGARHTLGLMVSSLKRSPTFARVDLLSEDLRRSLANTNVLVRDRHFALALDFATTEFQAPPASRRPRTGTSGRSVLRSATPARTVEDAAGPQPNP